MTRNSAALDQYDGLGDELVGDDGDVHELELDDVDAWEDETTVGDPEPAPPEPAKPAAAAAKKAPAKKAAKAPTAKKGAKR